MQCHQLQNQINIVKYVASLKVPVGYVIKNVLWSQNSNSKTLSNFSSAILQLKMAAERINIE